jgi:hypothetical protein
MVIHTCTHNDWATFSSSIWTQELYVFFAPQLDVLNVYFKPVLPIAIRVCGRDASAQEKPHFHPEQTLMIGHA